MDEETKGQKRITRQHQVYALVDPRDKKVRYIGISINPYTRLLHHLNEIESGKDRTSGMKSWNASPFCTKPSPLFCNPI